MERGGDTSDEVDGALRSICRAEIMGKVTGDDRAADGCPLNRVAMLVGHSEANALVAVAASRRIRLMDETDGTWPGSQRR